MMTIIDLGGKEIQITDLNLAGCRPMTFVIIQRLTLTVWSFSGSIRPIGRTFTGSWTSSL